MEDLVTHILKLTGYRFRGSGFFGRFGRGRQLLKRIGVRVGHCNLRADFREIGK